MNHNLSASHANNTVGSVLLNARKTPSPSPAAQPEVKVDFRDTMSEVVKAKASARQDQLDRAAIRRDKAEQQAAEKADRAVRPDRPVEQPARATARANRANHPDKSAEADVREVHEGPESSQAADNTKPTDQPAGDKANASINEQTPVAAESALVEQATTDEQLLVGLTDTALIPEETAEASEPLTVNSLTSPLATENGLADAAAVTAPATSTATNSGITLPPVAADSSGLASSLARGASDTAGKTAELSLATAGKQQSSMALSSEQLGSAEADGASLLEAESEFALSDEMKSPFSRLLAAAQGAGKEGQALSPELQLLAKTTNPAPTTNEASSRPAELQAPGNRAFVVQTGVAMTMGQPRWGQAVGERVLWLAAQNVSSAEIRLDPPELGPMQVRVSIQTDQASVSFSSPHPMVREALDQSATRLREMFNEQGLNLTNVDVSDQSFARHQAQEEQDGKSANGSAPGSDDPEGEVVAGVTTDIASLRLVDHYA
jgi:flagellar hook-length control protein FliK